MEHEDRFSLKGQYALVLGGMSGIGKAIAHGMYCPPLTSMIWPVT